MTIQVNPEDDFHVVKNGHVMALTLDELNTSYQRDLIADDTLIWQEGLDEWMRLDTLLYELQRQEGPVAPSPPLPEDTYYVLVAEGDVKQMSLDLLADAYRLDVIDDSTLVWQTGYTEWLPLSVIIGEEHVQHVSIAPSMAPQAPLSSGFGGGPLEVDPGSLAPSALWTPPQPEKPSPWYGRSLVAVGLLAILFVSHRNGATETAAETLEQGAAYSKMEAHIGAPGLDTVQGLDRWLSELSEKNGLADLAETEPVPREETAVDAPPASDAQDPNKEEKLGVDKAADASKKVAEGAEAADKDEKVKADPGKDTANAFNSMLKGEPKKPAAAAVRKTHRKPKSPIYKGPAGDRNDPMNGSL